MKRCSCLDETFLAKLSCKKQTYSEFQLATKYHSDHCLVNHETTDIISFSHSLSNYYCLRWCGLAFRYKIITDRHFITLSDSCYIDITTTCSIECHIDLQFPQKMPPLIHFHIHWITISRNIYPANSGKLLSAIVEIAAYGPVTLPSVSLVRNCY
jgi:hypothetical protein